MSQANLYKDLVRRMTATVDEATFNQKFPIFVDYHILSLCATALRKPIPHEQEAKSLYRRLNKARMDGDWRTVSACINQLKKLRIDAERIVQEFHEHFKNVSTEAPTRPDVYRPDCCGVLSHEFS